MERGFQSTAGTIDSTFEAVTRADRPALRFQGTHVADRYTVAKDYYVHPGSSALEIHTEYRVGSRVLTERTRWQVLTYDGRLDATGEGIDRFCRSDHYADPELDIEVAIEAAERFDR